MMTKLQTIMSVTITSVILSLAATYVANKFGAHPKENIPVKIVESGPLTKNELLMKRTAEGDLSGVKQLIESGALLDFRDGFGWTPLIQAAALNQVEIVKYLVLKGADVNAMGDDKSTALQQAVNQDNPAMVRFLLARGADPEEKAKYDWNLRETATMRNAIHVLRYLNKSEDTIVLTH